VPKSRGNNNSEDEEEEKYRDIDKIFRRRTVGRYIGRGKIQVF